MDDSIIHINSDTSENEQLLKAMGFNDEANIREALKLSKNDINEAVAYLTNEKMPKLVNTNFNTSNFSNSNVNNNNNNNNDENEILMSDEMIMLNNSNQNFKRINSNNINNSSNNDNDNLDTSLTNNVIHFRIYRFV